MKLLNTIATTAVISTSLFTAMPSGAFWGKKDTDKQHQNAKPFKPRKLIEEYSSNPNRARTNFSGLYFTYTGKVKDIYGNTIELRDNIKTSSGKRYELIIRCETPIHYERDETTKRKLLSIGKGEFTTISFEGYISHASGIYYDVKGRDCRIK